MWLIHQFDSLLNLGICKEYSYMAKAKTPRVTDATRNKQVIQMPEPGTSTTASSETKKNSAPVNSPVSIDIQGEIRRRAYELYEQRGCTPGHEKEDWATAESEILARHNQQQSA